MTEARTQLSQGNPLTRPRLFPLGLDQDQERRARDLHTRSIVIDLLYQGPLGADDFSSGMSDWLRARWEERHDLIDVTLEALNLPGRLAVEGALGTFRELWLESGVVGGGRDFELATAELFVATAATAQQQFDAFDWLIKATTAKDFCLAKREGKAAAFIQTQLTFGPPHSLEIVEDAYRLGLRMLQLTYNTMSTIGTGCTERTDAGLSNFGIALVKRLNELGVIIDTAHCGRRTTLDAGEFSEQPVVASHTSAGALYPHHRSKSDDELQALAQTGGVIGVCAVPFFLTEDPLAADLNTWLDHVTYISELVGPEHVAVGTDWPMQLPAWLLEEVFPKLLVDIGFRPEHRINPLVAMSGFSHYLEYCNFSRGLVARGFTDPEIEGILGANFLRVFERVCG